MPVDEASLKDALGGREPCPGAFIQRSAPSGARNRHLVRAGLRIARHGIAAYAVADDLVVLGQMLGFRVARHRVAANAVAGDLLVRRSAGNRRIFRDRIASDLGPRSAAGDNKGNRDDTR